MAVCSDDDGVGVGEDGDEDEGYDSREEEEVFDDGVGVVVIMKLTSHNLIHFLSFCGAYWHVSTMYHGRIMAYIQMS